MNNELLFDWIQLVTSYADEKIIRANQNGPKPADPFITYQVISAVPHDFSRIDETEGAGAYEVDSKDTRRYDVTVDINAYGTSGLTEMQRLTQSNTRADVKQLFRDTGTSLLGSDNLQDFTDVGDTKYVPRYQGEFQFYVYVEFETVFTDWLWDDYRITGTLDGDTVVIESS